MTEQAEVITTIEELLIAAAERIQAGTADQLKIGDCLNSRLRIIGPSWDSRVDKRIAQYVIDLQGMIDGLNEDLKLGLKDGVKTIKVELKEGSSVTEVDWTELIKLLIKMRSDEVISIILFAIACASGCYVLVKMYQTSRKYNQKQKENELKLKELDIEKELKLKQISSEMATRAASHEMYEKALQALSNALEILREKAKVSTNDAIVYEKSFRTLIKSAEKIDAVEIGSRTEAVPTENLKMYLEKSERSEFVTTYCDGSYQTHSWILDADEVMLGLMVGDNIIKAGLMPLSESERKQLRADFNKMEDEYGRQFEMELSLNVLHNEHRIKRVEVIGRAAPREGSVPLQDLIQSLH